MSISEVISEGPLRFVAADCGDNGDAGEDVLSLCDLPLYGDAANDSFSSEDASSSFGDEFFEFSPRDHRDDFNHPGPYPVWDSCDILFCGKLIHTLPTSNPSVGDRTDQAAKRNKTGVAKKARAITYSSARCDKWYMLAFGLARFPSEMALSEMRRRQGKGNRLGANSCRSDSGEMVISKRTRGKKGGESVWGMLKLKLKDLGSSRRDAGDVVKRNVKDQKKCRSTTW